MAAPPGGVHGQSHLPAGKIPPLPPAQNASGRAAGRRGAGVLPAGGDAAVHGPCLLGRGDASPAAGAGRPDVLVRAGAGRKGTGAGEHDCLLGTGKRRPARRPEGCEPHRGPRHGSLDRRGRDQSGGGDGGRERQRRRHCAFALYAAGRCAAGPDLQGHQHHGQYAGLQKRKISLFWPRCCKTGRCGELYPEPSGGAALDHGGGVHPQ